MPQKKQALKKGIQSIDIGFSILTVLMKSAIPVPLKTISEKTGMSPSKIHSYLVSFCNLGMVEQNESTGFYSLGPYALKLGLGYLDQIDLFSVAKPLMYDLAVEIGQTLFLGVWGNRGPTIVYRVDGPYSQTIFDLRIGSVLPILDSALGLNFAANLPFSLIEPIIQSELKLSKNKARFKNEKDVKKHLETIRTEKISTCRGALLTDFTAISVPIFDYSGTITAGLTIMGRIDMLDDNPKGATANTLKMAGEKISLSRGFH